MEERELTQLLQRLGDRVTPGPAPVGRILAEGAARRRHRSGRVRMFAVAAAAAAVVGGGSVAAVVMDLPWGGSDAAESAGTAGGGEAATSGTEDSGSGSDTGSDAGEPDDRVPAADAVDALVVVPDVAQPGDGVELAPRDEERGRFGSVWRLERLTDDGWTWEYTLLSGGGRPTWWPAEDERPVEDDLPPFTGAIPLVIPPPADAGDYRICQVVGTEDLCGRLTVQR